MAGRRLRSLWVGRLAAEEQAFVWDRRDEAGRSLPSGVYLARVRAADRLAEAKRVLLR